MAPEVSGALGGVAERLPGRSRRRLVGGLAALIAVVIAIASILAINLGGSSHPAKAAGTAAGAATVTRRDLVSTDTESGTVSYANPQTVYDRLTGTITWLPVTGQVVKPGQALFDVNGQPVVLFDGTFPAYRDLGPGVTDGPDVLQLNRNLVSLGFADGEITVNDTWQAGTTAAVERWQGSLGETETGTITLGQVVFLPGPQRITQVNTSLGSNGSPTNSGSGSGSGSGSSAGANAVASVLPARPEFVSLPHATAGEHSSAQDSPSSPTTTAPASCKRAGASTSTPAASSSPASSTTPNTDCGRSGKPGSRGKSNLSAAELQALIALLKAETLALAKNKSSPASGSGSGAGGSGASGGSGGSGSGSGGSGSGSGSGSGPGYPGGAPGGSSSGSGHSGSGSSGSGPSGSGSSGSGSSGSGSSGSGSPGSGTSGGGGTAQAILDTTSNQLVVTVDLDASKQSEARVGAPVTVEMPDSSIVDGKITHVSPVAQNNSNSGSGSSGSGNSGGAGSGSSATIPVTIALRGHERTQGLDQATVSVNFEQQAANNVLSVPVTALLATQGGGYAVQEAAAPHRLIPVSTGLFAAGYVEISGPGIYPGLQVTDSQG
ncbi:MAG: hypothetical protein JO181_22480 [Solirubrobacterales bacterium]|nr:hypothetical protein [Solirubrobacterales bacterium]